MYHEMTNRPLLVLIILVCTSIITAQFNGCPKGTYVHGFTDDLLQPLPDATCEPCGHGTYNDEDELQFYLIMCNMCRWVCDAGTQIEVVPCSPTTDRVCACQPGYISSTGDPDRLDCVPGGGRPVLQECPPGQEPIGVQDDGFTLICKPCSSREISCEISPIGEVKDEMFAKNRLVIYAGIGVAGLLVLTMIIVIVVLATRKRSRQPHGSTEAPHSHHDNTEMAGLMGHPPGQTGNIHRPKSPATQPLMATAPRESIIDSTNPYIYPDILAQPGHVSPVVISNPHHQGYQPSSQTHPPHLQGGRQQAPGGEAQQQERRHPGAARVQQGNTSGTSETTPTMCTDQNSTGHPLSLLTSRGNSTENSGETKGSLFSTSVVGPFLALSGQSSCSTSGKKHHKAANPDISLHENSVALPKAPTTKKTKHHIFVGIWKDLLDILSPENIVDHLVTVKIISRYQYEEIRSKPNRYDKSAEILGIVMKHGDEGLAKLLHVLLKTDTDGHVAEIIVREIKQQGKSSEKIEHHASRKKYNDVLQLVKTYH